MHPQLTQALGTAQQEELARTAARRQLGGAQTRARSRHFLGARMGRYFSRGPEADQQSLCRADY